MSANQNSETIWHLKPYLQAQLLSNLHMYNNEGFFAADVIIEFRNAIIWNIPDRIKKPSLCL